MNADGSINGTSARVISKEDLIANKKVSGKVKDLAEQSTATYLYLQRTQSVEPRNTLNTRKLFSRVEHVELVEVFDGIYRIDRIKKSVKRRGVRPAHTQ